MKQPLKPNLGSQAKTLFVNEGNPIGLLVTNKGGRLKSSPLEFKTAEAALAWCRDSAAMMVYCPLSPARN